MLRTAYCHYFNCSVQMMLEFSYQVTYLIAFGDSYLYIFLSFIDLLLFFGFSSVVIVG